MNNNSWLQHMVNDTLDVGKAAVKVVPTVVGGIVGGRAGAAAGASLSTGVQAVGHQIAQHKTAGSLAQARAQDKARMSQQYGMNDSGTGVADD